MLDLLKDWTVSPTFDVQDLPFYHSYYEDVSLFMAEFGNFRIRKVDLD